MKTGFTPWSEAMLEDSMRCQRAACFALGCLEREHRLNLDALTAYWAHASMVWWAPLLPRRSAPAPGKSFLSARSGATPWSPGLRRDPLGGARTTSEKVERTVAHSNSRPFIK